MQVYTFEESIPNSLLCGQIRDLLDSYAKLKIKDMPNLIALNLFVIICLLMVILFKRMDAGEALPTILN